MYIKNRLFAKYGHDCTLPTGLEDLPMFRQSSNILIQIKNILIRFRMASELNFRCQTFLRSQKNVDMEHRKHVKYLYIVHPFSDFRKHWEVLMMVVLLAQFVMIPIDVSFHKLTMVYNYTDTMSWKRVRVIADCLCLVDVIMTFFTGYCDYKKNVVVMKPKDICIHYLLTYFIPDFLSCLPMEYDAFVDLGSFQYLISSLTYLSVLRLLRIFSFLRYCKQFCQTHAVNYATYKLSTIFIIYMLYCHLICCVTIFMATRYVTPVYHTSMYNQSRLEMPYNLLYDIETTYFYVFYETARLINNSGYLWLARRKYVSYTVVIWICSRIFYMYLIYVIIARTSAAQKYFEMVSELKDYMKHKKLPLYLQKRLLDYYEFRFEKTYFSEKEIINTISGQLRQEVVMHRCRKLVENVAFFKDLPLKLLLRIVTNLREEVFMINDVIIKAGTVGDCMYFIGTGTVAIYTKAGREICHLGDGEHFGEVALIVPHETRIAGVVAAETSELYRLDRLDFLQAILPYPDLLLKIEHIAQERLQETFALDARVVKKS